MIFENMSIARVILHEVFRRNDDRLVLPVRYGNHIVQLPGEALDDFKSRVTDALGNGSKSMEMTISNAAAGSVPEICSRLSKATDAQFVQISQSIADDLAAKQIARTLPGGIVVVFSGMVGSPARPYVGIIKAETQSGFLREVERSGISAAYLKDLFLTPAAKLYKIGLFVHTADQSGAAAKFPDGWKAFVFDSHMSSANRDGAAQYFYEAFLGCVIPQNSSFLTKTFFDHTKEFIRKMDVSHEKRADLLTGLYTYLKIDQTPTFSVNSFAKNYLPKEAADDFETFMTQRKFPSATVQKDISDLQNVLKLRKMVFSRGIKFTAPPEAFNDMVSVETIDGSATDGSKQQWTRITIRDHIHDDQ